MGQSRAGRSAKRRRGQFLTPRGLAAGLVEGLELGVSDRVLEPGFGDGSFLLPLIERFLGFYEGSVEERLGRVLTENVWGVEIDPVMYERALGNIRARFGVVPEVHNLFLADFFETVPEGDVGLFGSGDVVLPSGFSFVVGNPPFGGSIAAGLQDGLERVLGWRYGLKIKKETYSWFIVKCMDLLGVGGRLRFICSDTFLTISTMKGLRNVLMTDGDVVVSHLDKFSVETSYPMVVLDWVKGGGSGSVCVDGRALGVGDVGLTENLSWGLTEELVPFFTGRVVGDVLVATSGMTTGANELFVREVVDGGFWERFEFGFVDVPVTLERELERARLGRLSERRRVEVVGLEAAGVTRRELVVSEREEPVWVEVPHRDYRPYNKAVGGVVWREPSHYIFWRDDGDAVLTFKRTGNWYLRGVGGRKFFGREGLTWRLVSSRLDVRLLGEGYVLDSGAPCAFPRSGVGRGELLFVMGWLLTDRCSQILKRVVNHTMNIQGKDVERLPYPVWVSEGCRVEAVGLVECMVGEAKGGRVFDRSDEVFGVLEGLYARG